MKKILLISILLMIFLFLSACGNKNSKTERFEIVNGVIVDNGTETVSVGSGGRDDIIFVGQEAAQSNDFTSPVSGSPEESKETYTAEESGSMDLSLVNDGIAYSADGEYGGSSAEMSGKIDLLKMRLSEVCSAVRDIYLSADKGTSYNVTLSSADIAAMLSACGSAGYAVTDSLRNFNMQCCGALHEFGQSISLSDSDITGTYFVIYPDGHLSGFMLSREGGIWYLYSSSAAWNEDGSERIYSEGRYAVGEVRYTEKGWLIYSRAASDYDENLNANADSYVMVRVLPYDSEMRTLCRRYVEPVGYLENNLFTTSWSENNMGPIDFNSLYAYIFGMYNGTDMLSSYNIRSYYKAVQGTRLYLVPTDTFENNTTVYFNIDRSALKNISDYSSTLGGYLFLGYNRDYYNVPPKTPFPEVVSYSYNSNGTITMIVDAVNEWYGTDRAFRHELVVRPSDGASFKYVSNRLIEDENNIIPPMKLSELLNVELTKTTLAG